jgi:type I site-specific restriction-modification system R (restriction) subunit
MSKEFKRMQQLAGINEIKVIPGGGFAKVLDEYIKSVLTQEEYYQDEPEAVEYFASLKSYPEVKTADETAEKIEEIDNTLTELSGAYLGEFYSEAVLGPLVDIGKKFPNLKLAIKQIIEILHKLYDIDETDIQDYNEYISNQWHENRIYQDILDLYIRHTYVQNFRLLATHEGEILKYINSLNNFPPKVNSLEELASAIVTINNKISELKADPFSYDGVDVILNKIAASNPQYKSIIDTLLGDDDLL